MKQKPIYGVWLSTNNGIGLQPVKATSKIEARTKFKKRFPKKSIISCEKLSAPSFMLKSHAI